MSPKISVLTFIYRPGYIDSSLEALKAQTFKDFEWVIVDDLWHQRKDMVREYVGDSLLLKHVPPRIISPYFAGNVAVNTGLIHAEGELIYLMADYMYIHPRTLERHWEIYRQYGPKVIISGPLIDAIVDSGKSVLEGEPPRLVKIRNDEGELVDYYEPSPPISWPLKDDYEEPTAENLISIFKVPFEPEWRETLACRVYPPDWRIGTISKTKIAEGLYENDDNNWWWGGKNDSAPLEALLGVNGMDETWDGRRGGSDGDTARRLMEYGCRYLVDREVPGYMLPHPCRPRANISEKDHLDRIIEKRKGQENTFWALNNYNLREERMKRERIKAGASIILPHIGPASLLKNCINSIRESTREPCEFAIISDKPDSETLDYTSSLSGGNTLVVINPERIGGEAAFNRGLQMARGNYLSIVTIGVTMPRGAIEAMKRALNLHPEFGWVALSTEHTGFYGGCSMMTREAFEKVGLWDESLNYAFNDDDYLRRMWQAGYTPHILDGFKIAQKEPEVVAKSLYGEEERQERFARAQALFHEKWGEWSTNWDALPMYQLPTTGELKEERMHRIDWIKSKVAMENTILEVGCAENPVWAGTPFKVTTLDKSTRPDEQCFPDIVGEAENLPVDSGAYDIVAIGELLEHVPDPQIVIKEAIRAARKKVIVTVPWEQEWPAEYKPFWNPGHIRFYAPETLSDELARTGRPFEITRIRYDGWAWLGAEIYCKEDKPVAQLKKLNIGSFTVMLPPPEWLNLDIIDLTDYAKQHGFNFQQVDVTLGLPLENNSIDFINASHLIEHLTVDEGIVFLKACHRVLKSGEKVRLGTPDVNKLIDAYLHKEMDKFCHIQPEEYKQAPSQADKLWRMLVPGHKTCYDFTALHRSLEMVGFTEIKEVNYDRETDMFPEVSLYVEGRKGPLVEVEQPAPADIPEYWTRFATENRMGGENK